MFGVRPSARRTSGPPFGLSLSFSCIVSPTLYGGRVGARTAPVAAAVFPAGFSVIASMVSGYIRPLPDLGERKGRLRRLGRQTLHKALAKKFHMSKARVLFWGSGSGTGNKMCCALACTLTVGISRPGDASSGFSVETRERGTRDEHPGRYFSPVTFLS